MEKLIYENGGSLLMPQCRVCATELDDNNWYQGHRKINSRICKNCVSEWGAAHYAEKSDSIKTRVKVYYNENKDSINTKKRNRWKNDSEYREAGLEQGTKYHLQLKTDAIFNYSNGSMACANPHNIHLAPFTILEALSIDHPLNNGANERLKLFGNPRGGGNFYSWLKVNGYPKGYRVLCMTCQMISEIRRKRELRKKDTKHSRYRARLKFSVLYHYSGTNPPQCADPEHIHDTPFTIIDGLSLEHLNGGGTQHYKRLGVGSSGMYQWVEKNGYPEGYAVLCLNCQFITAAKRRRVK